MYDIALPWAECVLLAVPSGSITERHLKGKMKLTHTHTHTQTPKGETQKKTNAYNLFFDEFLLLGVLMFNVHSVKDEMQLIHSKESNWSHLSLFLFANWNLRLFYSTETGNSVLFRFILFWLCFFLSLLFQICHDSYRKFCFFSRIIVSIHKIFHSCSMPVIRMLALLFAMALKWKATPLLLLFLWHCAVVWCMVGNVSYI